MDLKPEMCDQEVSELFDDGGSEREHFLSIITAFAHYRIHTLNRVNKTIKYIESLPNHHRAYLKKYGEYLIKIKYCVEQNDLIIKEILRDCSCIFENIPRSKELDIASGSITGDGYMDATISNMASKLTVEDIEKVQSIFKLFVRDWSAAGSQERAQCYDPIIKEICKEFPSSSGINVLVPGAGLGRLAFEIASRGFKCQGNEFSLYMLLASNFVLNKCHKENTYKVYPWVHQFVNNISCDYQVNEVSFPDVNPSILKASGFSMAAGDFLKVYTEPDEWNCVATCFFIDCAPNIINFVETIYKILTPGGIWVNLGPLLYHYSDMVDQNSIEPPFDILCDIILDVGFIIEKQQTGLKSQYSQNPHSMLHYNYSSVFFVCRKPALIE